MVFIKVVRKYLKNFMKMTMRIMKIMAQVMELVKAVILGQMEVSRKTFNSQNLL